MVIFWTLFFPEFFFQEGLYSQALMDKADVFGDLESSYCSTFLPGGALGCTVKGGCPTTSEVVWVDSAHFHFYVPDEN